jgi:hypothetical protein
MLVQTESLSTSADEAPVMVVPAGQAVQTWLTE